MKKGLKRVLSSMLAAAVIVSAGTFINDVAPNSAAVTATDVYAADVSISECQGWLETAWVKWSPVSGASSYKVYYKKTSDSNYTKIDDMLLRKYNGYWRADVLGLPAGSYNIKVEAFDSNGSIGSAESTAEVKAQDRSGFAFKGTTTPGAYNADGSLKSGAKVIYLTNDNFDNAQVTIVGKNGASVVATGFDEILKNLAYAYDAPTAIRIIGRIDSSKYNNLTLSEKCVQMKGLESGYNKNDYTCEVTIEGVGDDAALGGGTCFYKPSYCEMRNLAIGGFGDDGVSLKTASYMWLHNLELMYGNAGSDADQAKGDGSIDLKDNSQYVTISYVHFWDSGKSSLCGMKSESGPNYITYHHNWFDHSDSRHPRIRTMSVHLYNNFFDGNAKYGVGVTKGASAFVENNVFKDCKHPMLISMQGSDLMGSGGAYVSSNATFDEPGGIIKAYNNQITGASSVESASDGSTEPIYYGTSSTTDSTTNFDAYLVTNRADEVPSSVKSLSGGNTYNNEALALSNLNATPEPVETVEATVTTYAGRVNGGDFLDTIGSRSNYTGLTDATSYAVDQPLKTQILSYVATVPYTSVGPNEDGSTPDTPVETTTASSETQTETTTKSSSETDTETTTESSIEQPTEQPTVDPAGAASEGTYIIGKNATGGTFNVTSADSFGNVDFSSVRSIESAGGAKLRAANKIAFTLSSEATISISSSGTDAVLSDGTKTYPCTGENTYTVPAGSYTISGTQSSSATVISKIVIEYTDKPVDTSVKGDADDDGSVTLADVKAVLDYVVGNVTGINSTNADVNSDKSITSRDAYIINSFLKTGTWGI